MDYRPVQKIISRRKPDASGMRYTMTEIWLPGYGPRDAWSKKAALFAHTIYVRRKIMFVK